MPIWLRKFTFETLREHYEKLKEEQEKQNNTLTNKSGKEITKPNVATPTYTSKVPKK